MMLFRFSVALLVLGVSLQVQGSFVDMIVEEIHVLAEKLDEELEEYLHIPAKTKKLLEEKYSETQENVNAHAETMVKEAEEKVANMDCSPEVRTALKSVPTLVGGRFISCINFTQTIINLEVFIYNTIAQMGGVEEQVCDGIERVLSCNSTKTLEKMACMSSAVKTSAEKIRDSAAGVIASFKQLISMGNNIIEDFIKCFMKSKQLTQLTIQTELNKHCKVPSKIN